MSRFLAAPVGVFRYLPRLGLFALLWLSSGLAQAENSAVNLSQLEEKDLAIAFAHTNTSLLKAGQKLSSGQQLLPLSWYQDLLKAYLASPVGNALEVENKYEDWQLVSLRIAPCEPLGLAPGHDIERLCWPEVRLIWQPIMRKFVIHNRFVQASADDRAIHAIYRLAPEIGLSEADAGRAKILLGKIDSYVLPNPPTYAPLNSQELDELQKLRQPLVQKLLTDSLGLRSKNLEAGVLKGVGLRPEPFMSAEEAGGFMQRLLAFLSIYTPPNRMRVLTSFSLPEGRDPPTLDEWFFLAFSGSAERLKPAPIALHSLRDGRPLGKALPIQRGTMARDDDFFYSEEISADQQKEIAESLMLFVPDIFKLTPLLMNRQQALIPNTSCVSCHKMNGERFNFHNFSYLEDEELSVSPRVTRDVELDLAWVEKYLLKGRKRTPAGE